jgi:hypothetical protein
MIDINLLKKNSCAKRFSDAEIIIREGDKMGDEMYVILEGKVGVYRNFGQPNEINISTLNVGNFFGEMTLFLHRERTATVVAQGTVILLAIGRVAAYEFFETQPQLTYLVMKTLCTRLEKTNKILSVADITVGHESGSPSERLFSAEFSAPVASAPVVSAPPPSTTNVAQATKPASVVPTPASVVPPAPASFISDTPPPGFIADTPVPSSLPDGLFPEGHQIYKLQTKPASPELIYKKNFKCPVCDKTFSAYSVRTTRLKIERRDKDFRSHYNGIDTTYYEIITCTECYFSNFEAAYAQPIVSRFKESIGQITEYKKKLNIDITEDRNINNVFAGYFLALKGAPLFYKNHEMFVAKIWLRLIWLYDDCRDGAMVEAATKNAHKAYLSAFEKTDATPEALQQLSVLIGELSLMVRDIPNAKLFFVKARSYRGGSKAYQTQAEDGIETIRKIESGQIKL